MNDASSTPPPAGALPASLTKILDASDVPVVFADGDLEDVPLVYANDAFCRLSGYGRDEVLGRNCRFLQPSEGAGPVRARIRSFLTDADRHQDRFLIPNIRKSGEPFLNLLYMSKLKRRGRRPLFLGSQFDIAARSAGAADAYDRALASDIRDINALTHREGWSMLGSTATLASSFETIVQAKLND